MKRSEVIALRVVFQDAIKEAESNMKMLQEICRHPKVVKTHKGNTGNWCKSDDRYWTEFDCPDCGKHWEEDGSV